MDNRPQNILTYKVRQCEQLTADWHGFLLKGAVGVSGAPLSGDTQEICLEGCKGAIFLVPALAVVGPQADMQSRHDSQQVLTKIACKRLFGACAHHTPAIHRLDASECAKNYLQGALDPIIWPPSIGQIGRLAELDGSKHQGVYLDTVSVARAVKLGKGNLSEWTRIALSRV